MTIKTSDGSYSIRGFSFLYAFFSHLHCILLSLICLPDQYAGSSLSQIVPVITNVLTPGVTLHAPVSSSRANVAAGTVICPGTVEKSPTSSS